MMHNVPTMKHRSIQLFTTAFILAVAAVACVPAWDEQDGGFDASLSGRYTVATYAASQQGCEQFLLPDTDTPPETLVLGRTERASGSYLSFSSCSANEECSAALLFHRPTDDGWHARRVETYRTGEECVAFWTDSLLSPLNNEDGTRAVSVKTTRKIATIPLSWSPSCSPEDIQTTTLVSSCTLEQSITAHVDTNPK